MGVQAAAVCVARVIGCCSGNVRVLLPIWVVLRILAIGQDWEAALGQVERWGAAAFPFWR